MLSIYIFIKFLSLINIENSTKVLGLSIKNRKYESISLFMAVDDYSLFNVGFYLLVCTGRAD